VEKKKEGEAPLFQKKEDGTSWNGKRWEKPAVAVGSNGGKEEKKINFCYPRVFLGRAVFGKLVGEKRKRPLFLNPGKEGEKDRIFRRKELASKE